MTKLIDNDVSARVLDMDETVDAIRDAFTQLGTGDAAFYPRVDIAAPTANQGDFYVWGSLLGAIREPPRLAFRFKSDQRVWEDHDGRQSTMEKFNTEPGVFMGFILLFDIGTGELLGMLNDGVIQHARVGATAGVAADVLARKDASTLGILGSGGMARTYARAIASVRDIEGMKVFSTTGSHRHQFADEMSAELGVPVRAVSSPEEAMTDIDIAATCTDASEPVFRSEWLEDGLFLVDVRSKEIGADVVSSVDRVLGTVTEGYQHRVIGTDEERQTYYDHRGTGGGYRDREYTTLPKVLTTPSLRRRSRDETIYYSNRSAGVQFAAVANLVYERALEGGLGVTVPLDWFQQSIRD